ncbi:hypothetical protein 6 [Wuhan heteroptera virus 3]|uniref:hypothetical protein 6 n=1 Tax=Wuhan heteroptera virus 3 TaxID=1923703 RepID=UPI00090B9C7F|nr:hypothetical protein 6 [Wuhan heteroptera virus 3]APG79074.1 hypothetical protein 7 [Wuhan heteroptera virus 3]APG79210.1 hypothetical protein 6 [Wuhan heteroptera virus 3]
MSLLLCKLSKQLRVEFIQPSLIQTYVTTLKNKSLYKHLKLESLITNADRSAATFPSNFQSGLFLLNNLMWSQCSKLISNLHEDEDYLEQLTEIKNDRFEVPENHVLILPNIDINFGYDVDARVKYYTDTIITACKKHVSTDVSNISEALFTLGLIYKVLIINISNKELKILNEYIQKNGSTNSVNITTMLLSLANREFYFKRCYLSGMFETYAFKMLSLAILNYAVYISETNPVESQELAYYMMLNFGGIQSVSSIIISNISYTTYISYFQFLHKTNYGSLSNSTGSLGVSNANFYTLNEKTEQKEVNEKLKKLQTIILKKNILNNDEVVVKSLFFITILDLNETRSTQFNQFITNIRNIANDQFGIVLSFPTVAQLFPMLYKANILNGVLKNKLKSYAYANVEQGMNLFKECSNKVLEPKIKKSSKQSKGTSKTVQQPSVYTVSSNPTIALKTIPENVNVPKLIAKSTCSSLDSPTCQKQMFNFDTSNDDLDGHVKADDILYDVPQNKLVIEDDDDDGNESLDNDDGENDRSFHNSNASTPQKSNSSRSPSPMASQEHEVNDTINKVDNQIITHTPSIALTIQENSRSSITTTVNQNIQASPPSYSHADKNTTSQSNINYGIARTKLEWFSLGYMFANAKGEPDLTRFDRFSSTKYYYNENKFAKVKPYVKKCIIAEMMGLAKIDDLDFLVNLIKTSPDVFDSDPDSD